MNYDFKEAYSYAENVSIDNLFKRSLSYNAYVGLSLPNNAQTVGHDVVLSIVGSIYGPLGNLNSEQKLEMEKFLEFIDKGFGNWGVKLEKWIYSKAKTQQDMIYFEKMYDVLMKKSDDVYYLLSNNTNIPRDEILYDILVAGASFSKGGPAYRKWIYI